MSLADLPVEEIKNQLGLPTVYKLSFNENPMGPSPNAKKAMREAIEDLNLYPSSTGVGLQQKLAEIEGVSKESIILSNGADEMIALVSQTFLNSGDEVIIPKVTFVQYLASTLQMGATPVFAPMKEDMGIDLEAIRDRITPKTKLIFLCNPNNPTGKAIPKHDLDAFFAQLPDHVLVVMDEAYHEYGIDGEYVSSVTYVKQKKQVLVVRTFSKVYSLAAARVGYGIASPDIIEAMHHVRPPFNVNSVAQVGAVASLEDKEYLKQGLEVNDKGKAILYKAFDRLGCAYLKSNGNFVYVDTGLKSGDVFQKLAKKGVIVRDLSGYGLTTSLRISVGSEVAINVLIKELTKIIGG